MKARFQRETPVLKYALFCRSAQIAGLQHKILDAEQGKHYAILFVFFVCTMVDGCATTWNVFVVIC